jgi:hypothetical protein
MDMVSWFLKSTHLFGLVQSAEDADMALLELLGSDLFSATRASLLQLLMYQRRIQELQVAL